MNVSQLKQSRFLTRADVGAGVLVTINEIFQENVAKEGAPEEMRWCISFREMDKPMVLNSTNGQIIASIVKSDETDDWPGYKIVLYDDPSVSFGGKLVGGIRCRAPRLPAQQQARPQAPRQTYEDGTPRWPAPQGRAPKQNPTPKPPPQPEPPLQEPEGIDTDTEPF